MIRDFEVEKRSENDGLDSDTYVGSNKVTLLRVDDYEDSIREPRSDVGEEDDDDQDTDDADTDEDDSDDSDDSDDTTKTKLTMRPSPFLEASLLSNSKTVPKR
ncbi:hypothetical protein OEA41_008988 [Lepraria neglecta]|uniref:Uncharacterized protein n=1 Tax=Lepraria neglecta TaxID=209136 RepID=A0AAD9Z0R9_9LECA|nr:hypothetical protein OEA41_008988 [Lepraria neglecta]